MVTSDTAPASAAPKVDLPETPRGLHHQAFVTQDAVATVDFYTRVLRMPLITTVINNEIALTREPYPYLHLFFRMWDGSTIAFFESPGLPPPAKSADPAYDIFNHLALDVGSREEVDRWAAYLADLGIETVGPKEHGIIYSLYLHDPDGHRIELTTNLDLSWQSLGDAAQEDVRRWAEAKRAAGGDPAALRDWIEANRKYPGRAH
jgi:catechol 2,3-dioxygenase-like lactoylglutathione lyase family enzyme